MFAPLALIVAATAASYLPTRRALQSPRPRRVGRNDGSYDESLRHVRMHYVSVGVVTMLVLASQIGGAQQIRATVQQAEVEGAAFPHGVPPTALGPAFAERPFGGTSERRCVPSIPDDSLPGGALRSGDFIIRTRFTGRGGLRVTKSSYSDGSKILWIPRHGSADRGDTLLLRAVRMASPPDSFRQRVTDFPHSHGEYGFVSGVRFPAPGQWLVVATAGTDWGCFLLGVAD
jgi:hypothetical protein